MAKRTLLKHAEQRADRACGKLMDEFGIKRCPENYLKIIEILHEYRAFTRRAKARKGRKHG